MTDATKPVSPDAAPPAVRRPRSAEVLLDDIAAREARGMTPIHCPGCGKKVGEVVSAEQLHQRYLCQHCKHEFSLVIEKGRRAVIDRLAVSDAAAGG